MIKMLPIEMLQQQNDVRVHLTKPFTAIDLSNKNEKKKEKNKMLNEMMNEMKFTLNNQVLYDMRNVYRAVLENPISQTRPTTNPVVIGQDLPAGMDCMGAKLLKKAPVKLVLIDKTVAEEDIPAIYRKASISRKNDIVVSVEQNPLTTDFEMTELYGIALMVTDMLDVECPQIIIMNLEQVSPGMGGLAINPLEASGRTTAIYLAPRSLDMMAKTLVHELRHAWQHKYGQDEYFGNYRTYGDFAENEKENYYLQPAELDAESFAWEFMLSQFGMDFRGTKSSAIVNNMIAAEMDKHRNQFA